MISVSSLNENVMLEAVRCFPNVSIILPFEPKMSGRTELEYKLQRVIEHVESDLNKNYASDKSEVVIARLKGIIKSIDYTTYKKSIAIFISPVLEKIYYLDIPVEEKFIIDESFEIRDLVYSKKEIHKYLVLVLSGKRSALYLGNTTQFIRLAVNRPEHFSDYNHEAPERTGNFSDPAHYKDVLFEKFLHHVDNRLGIMLNAYQLPLFVMAVERTMGHFKKISRYNHRITGYVHGNFEDCQEAEIRKAVAPHVSDWKTVVQRDLLLRLDAAKGAGKLAIGISDVWREAVEQRGKLLIVEKNYMCPAKNTGSESEIAPHDEADPSPWYIKDAVDDVIEKVLANGGDVEFVDEYILSEYQRIALIKYY